ncbi:HTH_48 domain-containing protein [Nephila pilipes]|uniref:HTH_48 domain-containing protein n=1 Tax=Nephila pilipes TaxID=299642 RepID=A0A8X6T2X2_NEPPI|nr:HTH_48 domain-containing protein [Nephila pilipes]
MGKNTVQAKQWIEKCYPDSCPSKATICRWFAEFKRGRTDTNDAERSGRPVEAVTPENYCDKKNLNTEEISNLYQSSKKRRTSHFNGSDLEALKCNGKNKNCQSPTSPESCHSSKIKKKKKNRWKRKRNKNKKKFIDFDEPMASDNSDCIRNVINPVSPPKEPFQHMKVLNSLHHCENSNSISSQLKCPISESTESFNIDNIMNAMNSASYSENSSSVSPPLVSSNPRFHTINSVTPCDKFPISEYEMVNQVSPLLKSSSTPEPRNANSFPSPVTFTIQAQNHLKKFAIQNCETNFVSSPVISPVSEKSKLKSSPPVVEYSSPVSRSENNFNISVKSLPNVTKKICLVSPPTKSPDPKNSDLVNENNVTNFLSEKISFSSQVSTHTESSGSDVEVNISNQNHIHLKGFEQKIINTHQSPSGANRSIDPVQLLYKIKSYISDALEHGIEDSKQGFIDKESTMMCDKPDSHEQNSNFKDVHVACAVSETMCKNTNMVLAHSPHPKNSDLVSQINLTNFLSENNFSTQVPSHTESSGSEFEVNISNQNHIHLKGFEQKIINMHQSLSVADRPIDPVQCKIKSYIPDALKHGIWDSKEATKESTVMCVKPQSQLENTNFEEFHVACVSETIGKDTSMVPAQKSNMLSDKQGNEIQNVNFENPFSFHHTTKLRMYDTCEKPTENCSMQCDVPGSKMQTPNSIAEFRVKNTNQVPMEVSSLQINYPESKKQDTNLAPTEEYMQTTNFKNSFMVHNTKLAMVDSIQVSTKESNMQYDKQESEMQVSVQDPMEVCSLQEDNPENQMQGLSQAPTERCNLLYDKSNSEMQTPESKNSFMTHHNAPVVMCDSNQSPVIEESCLQCDKPKNKKQDPKNYFGTHKDAEFRLQNSKEICREKDLNIQCDESSSNLLLDTNFIESLMEWEPTKWHVFPNLAADPDKDQDFKKYYVKITSMDQRNAYKAYFNIAYELYCDLWKSVKNAFDRVKSIENVLKIYQEGTYEHERIASLLRNVYSKYLQDPSFSSAICKRDFLHEKLCHIKKLIIEFDIENEH